MKLIPENKEDLKAWSKEYNKLIVLDGARYNLEYGKLSLYIKNILTKNTIFRTHSIRDIINGCSIPNNDGPNYKQAKIIFDFIQKNYVV